MDYNDEECRNTGNDREWSGTPLCMCFLLPGVGIYSRKHTNLHGDPQCLANVFQALWSIFFILRLFLVSEIMLLLSAFLMLTVWMTLLKYPANFRNPFTWLFVHVPMRMYLLWLINLAIWQNGLIALR